MAGTGRKPLAVVRVLWEGETGESLSTSGKKKEVMGCSSLLYKCHLPVIGDRRKLGPKLELTFRPTNHDAQVSTSALTTELTALGDAGC